MMTIIDLYNISSVNSLSPKEGGPHFLLVEDERKINPIFMIVFFIRHY